MGSDPLLEDEPTGRVPSLEISLLSAGEENADMGECDFEEEGYDIDDALDALGMGPFQYRLIFLVAIAWAFNALVTMVTPFFVAGMERDLGLTASEEGFVAAALLFGLILGNFGFGYVSDKVGRRRCILVGVVGVGLLTSLAAAGQSWWHVAVSRVGVGFFISGSMVPANSLVSELVPRASRGRWLAGLHVFWQFGTLAMVAITTELHGKREWRLLILATALPSIVVFGAMLLVGVPESPRYLLLMKRKKECMQVLNAMAYQNDRCLPDSELRDLPPHPTVQPLAALAEPEFFTRTTLPLWVMFFWLNWASYGNTMWLKAYFGALDMAHLQRPLYFSMAIGRVLGVSLCALVIEWVPRRTTLAAAFISSGVCTFAAVLAHGGEEVVDGLYIQISGNTLVLVLFSLAALFEEASWGAIYTYSVEVYPSSIRSTGSGIAMSVGRMGGIIATAIGKKLMQEDPRLPFYLTSLAFLLAAVAVGVCRAEPKGQKLADILT